MNLEAVIIRQFSRPSGILGRVAGWIMRTRPSNRERNRRTVELLDIQPVDAVLEIGFGPGLAIALAAARAPDGQVFGIDHSPLMVRQASRTNADAIRAGKVHLRTGSADDLPPFPVRFDRVFGVNVYQFWKEPVPVLRGLLQAMNAGGTIALTLQPRQRGATNADTRTAAGRIAASLADAGFTAVRTEILELRPVNAACVLARRP